MDQTKKVVTRFAPSPTGYLHVGGLRTALFSYLWAKKNNGKFILRIEDTDRARLVEDAEQKLLDILKQFGLNNDLFFRQSDRLDIYRQAANKLVTQGSAYRCYCTTERLAELRKQQEDNKQQPRYDGRCRDLSADEIAKHQNDPYTVRFKISATGVVKFLDFLRGDMQVESKDLDDFIILKSDGWPTYHLASVVDDNEMGITHVLRAEEWLPSLPRHVLLYQAFGYELPIFVHLTLLLNPDKSKLSKRQGDVATEDYLTKGYLKEALINYIALLGWNPGGDQEFFTLTELEQLFDITKLNKSAAIFDLDKLKWFNAHYIRKAFEEKGDAYNDILFRLQSEFLAGHDSEIVAKVFSIFASRLDNLSELSGRAQFIFQLSDYDAKLLIFKKSDQAKTNQGLQLAAERWGQLQEWEQTKLEESLKDKLSELGLSFGDVFWPVRVALSGLESSPSPVEIAWVLGKQETIRRLDVALKKIRNVV